MSKILQSFKIHLAPDYMQSVTKNGNNRFKVVYKNGNIGYWLHDTEIVRFSLNNITLNSDGWLTKTIKTAMNQVLPDGNYVYQKNGKWYVKNKDKTLEYKDNLEIPYNA